jgi:hypothetical protein
VYGFSFRLKNFGNRLDKIWPVWRLNTKPRHSESNEHSLCDMKVRMRIGLQFHHTRYWKIWSDQGKYLTLCRNKKR